MKLTSALLVSRAEQGHEDVEENDKSKNRPSVYEGGRVSEERVVSESLHVQ